MAKLKVKDKEKEDGNGFHPIGAELAKKLADAENLNIDDIEIETFTGSVSVDGKLGVHQRIITAVQSDKEYRQVLLTAAFDNKQEALLASDAITERIRYGVDITPIIDRVIAQCAVKGMRVETILNSMSTYTMNNNYRGNVPDWKKRQDNKSIG